MPNFLIIGAQKGGSTWLYDVLKDHPEVYLPELIELHHFNRINCNTKESVEKYSKNFPNVDSAYKMIGEKTPSYFWTISKSRSTYNPNTGHNPNLVRDVKSQLGDNLKVLVSLRHPVRRAISAFFHHVKRGRITGSVSLSSYYKKFGLLDIGFYDDHLNEWLKAYPKEQILSLIMERDIFHNPKGTLAKACEFLGVSSNVEIDLNRKSNVGLKIIWEDGIVRANIENSPYITAEEIEYMLDIFKNDMNKLRKTLGDPLDEWKKIDNELYKFVETARNGLYKGKDKIIFLTGGNHSVLSFFNGLNKVDENSKKNFFSNISERQKYSLRRSIQYKHIVFPEKLYIHKTSHDFDVKSLYRESYLDSEYYINELPILYPDKSLFETTQAFLKTDTHLSNMACKNVTKDILIDIFSPDEVNNFELFVKLNLSDGKKISGDLGRKYKEKIFEITQGFNKQSSLKIRSNGVQSGNDGILILLENNKALSDKVLLIFGDSFFRQLLPFMGFFFKKIVFCRTRFFHYELVKSIKPDIIFTGNAERYLSHVQNDLEREDFLLLPLLNDKEMKPDDGFGEMFKRMINLNKYSGYSKHL